MTKLKGETDAAKIFEPRIRGFGIHQQAFGQLSLWLVMIEHNHINTSFSQRSDFDGRGCPAIDGNEKLRIVLAKTARNSFGAQPVAFLDSTRQELISRSAKLAYPIRDGIPIMLPEEARKIE